MNTTNEKGFSAVEAIIILVIIAALGFGGWYVWHSKQDKSKDASTSTAKTSDSDQAKKDFELPAGWTLYENKELGFNFAYPEVWGAIKTADPSSDMLLNVYTEQYTDAMTEVDGRINLSARSAATFTFTPEKYSVTLKPVNNGAQWQITEVNPVVEDKYTVGDMYDLQGKHEVDGGVVYLTTKTDEGCKMNTYVFVLKDSYALLTTPALCAQGTPSAQNQTAYDETTATILDSVKISK
jgi:hypothetical protein